MSKAYRRLHSWTRRLARAERRTKQRLWVFVKYPIHQTAVTMLHHRTKVTRTISIMELLLIERMLTPINEINDPRPIHQPRRIDEKNRSTSPKGKGKRTEPEQREGNGCNCEYCKSPSKVYFRKLLQFETRGTPRGNKKSQNVHEKALLGLKEICRQKREESNSKIRVWREQDSETNFPSLSVIQTYSKNGSSPNAPPYNQRCTE